MAFTFGLQGAGPLGVCRGLGTDGLGISAVGYDDAGGTVQVLALFCVWLLQLRGTCDGSAL